MAKNMIGIFHEKCSVKLQKETKNILNFSGDHNVSDNVHEISTNALEAQTCNIHAIFITICCY